MSKTYDACEVGARLRLARLALGLTNEKTAETCRVTLRTYRGWDEGSRPMRRESAPIVASV